MSYSQSFVVNCTFLISHSLLRLCLHLPTSCHRVTDTRSPKAWIAWKKDGDPDSGDVHWLRDPEMLPEIIPNSRVFTYDWNANIDEGAANNSLLGHADQLLRRLHIRRQTVIFLDYYT